MSGLGICTYLVNSSTWFIVKVSELVTFNLFSFSLFCTICQKKFYYTTSGFVRFFLPRLILIPARQKKVKKVLFKYEKLQKPRAGGQEIIFAFQKLGAF